MLDLKRPHGTKLVTVHLFSSQCRSLRMQVFGGVCGNQKLPKYWHPVPNNRGATHGFRSQTVMLQSQGNGEALAYLLLFVRRGGGGSVTNTCTQVSFSLLKEERDDVVLCVHPSVTPPLPHPAAPHLAATSAQKVLPASHPQV